MRTDPIWLTWSLPMLTVGNSELDLSPSSRITKLIVGITQETSIHSQIQLNFFLLTHERIGFLKHETVIIQSIPVSFEISRNSAYSNQKIHLRHQLLIRNTQLFLVGPCQGNQPSDLNSVHTNPLNKHRVEQYTLP